MEINLLTGNLLLVNFSANMSNGHKQCNILLIVWKTSWIQRALKPLNLYLIKDAIMLIQDWIPNWTFYSWSVEETDQSKAVLHAFGSLKKRMIGISFLICKQLLLNKARLFLWINVNNTLMTIRIGMMILEPKLFTGSVPVQALKYHNMNKAKNIIISIAWFSKVLNALWSQFD